MALREHKVASQAGKGLSPKCWEGIDLGFGSFLSDWNHIMEDFRNAGDESTGIYGWGLVSGDTGAGIAPKGTGTDADLGVLSLTPGTTDNNEVYMQGANAEGAQMECLESGGLTGRPFAVEFRVAFPNVTNGNNFVGLAEPGAAAANFFTDAAAFVDKDLIGFHRAEGDGDDIDFVWNKAGGSVQTISDILTGITADQFYTLGFRYDPPGSDLTNDTGSISIYADNTEFGTKVTSANLSAATFPAAQLLSLMLACKNSSTTAASLDVDWVAFAQRKY